MDSATLLFKWSLVFNCLLVSNQQPYRLVLSTSALWISYQSVLAEC